MKESRDNLSEILQEKLLDYTSDVPESSSSFVLANLKSKPSRYEMGKKVIYSAAVLLLIFCSYLLKPLFQSTEPTTKTSEITSVSEATKTAAVNSLAAVTNKGESTIKQRRGGARNRSVTTALDGGSRNESGEALSLDNEEHNLLLSSQQVQSKAFSQDVSMDEKKESIDSLLQISILAMNSMSTDSTPGSRKKHRNWRFSASVMPFLNYRRIQPNGNDAAHLDGFQAPSGLNDRFGFQTSVLIDYEIKPNHFIYGGLSYFNYRNKFSYSSNEQINNVDIKNYVNERVQGISFLAGGRLPLKIHPKRKQFVSAGFDYQLLRGDYFPLTSRSQFMVNAGYANDFDLGKGHVLRLQPTLTYSVTSLQYGGLATHPYWFGFVVAYSWGVFGSTN